MKTQRFLFLLAFSLLASAPMPLRAQLVADGGTKIIDGTSTNISGNLAIGGSGSFTTLIVTNAGAVTNTGFGNIALSTSSMSNLVVVTGGNSVWLATADINVGSSGAYNRLVITNGGRVLDSAARIGNGTAAHTNTAIINGTNSLWRCSAELSVGANGSFNQLTIAKGGQATTGEGIIGGQPFSLGLGNHNLAVITDPGSRWIAANNMTVGKVGSFNELVVTNGGEIQCVNTYIGTTNFGVSSSNNILRVTGLDSFLKCSSSLYVGYDGTSNQLAVSSNGTVTAAGLLVGFNPASSNSLATVDGGNLRVTNSSGTAITDVRRGTLRFSGGNFLTDFLFATNSGTGFTNSTFTFNYGDLTTLHGSAIAQSNNFVIGNTSNQTAAWTISGGTNTIALDDSGQTTILGNTPGSRGVVMASGASTVWSNSSFLMIGGNSSASQLVVSNGARVLCTFGQIGGSATASSNAVFVTGAGSRWLTSGNVDVGPAGVNNLLVISNGGFVGATASGVFGVIGNGSTGNGNLAVVTGSGSVWSNTADLYVGLSGSANRLLVSNGGMVANDGAELGVISTSSNNIAWITDAGSLWTNSANLRLGDSGSGNLLVISNGARAIFQTATLSFQSASRGNQLVVTGTNSLWSTVTANTFTIGLNGASNQFLVANGASALTSSGVLGSNVASSNNTATITGSGSLWSNITVVTVGSSGSANRLVVSNGGWVLGQFGFMGFGSSSSNNVAIVSGAGSLWSNTFNVTIGQNGSRNTLIVSNNGMVSVGQQIILGTFATSTNNRVIVDGGTMQAFDGFGDGELDVRRGTNVLNAGLIDVDVLLLTNTLSFFEFNGGALRTGKTIASNGTFVVGNGVLPATLELVGGTHTFASGLRIANNGLLKGNGAITASVTNSAGGTLSPGASIGRFSVTGNVSLASGSTNIFEISKAAGTNDNLVVSGTVIYGGTLLVTNLAGTLTNGDTFRLFIAPVYQGTFSSVVLPPLDPGLIWTNKLLLDGSLQVISNPGRDFGVDVSHFQGESGISQASWNQMFAAGKRFVFVKATEALSFEDATMANNMTRATAAGLRAGVYHFAHPEARPTPAGAVQEADYFLTYAGNFIGPGYLRPVLDLESGSVLTTTALTDWVIAFANEIITNRGAGAAPIIYCSQNYANDELDSRLANYDLWLRTISGVNPGTNDPPAQGGLPDATGVFNDWSFWQYNASGSSGGISPLDLNVCHSEFKPLDSFLIPAVTNPVAPTIITQPPSRTVFLGNSASFSVVVSVSSSTPLSYQWRFDGTNLSGATANAYTLMNAQPADAGPYTVIITNAGGSATSAVATLTVTNPPVIPGIVLYQEDFDGYSSSSVVTDVGTTNGFKIFFGADAGPLDFTAQFGFDYSIVTSPTTIPSAPHSSGGTTKGLYLTVNKDGTPSPAAINLYPVSQTFTGNFSLKFDMWINYPSTASATEHALFGINHSAAVTNRVTQATSDGLFFEVDGDGGIGSGSATVRDFAIFRGANGAMPVLLTTANTTFGPEPLLGPNFDNSNPGFGGLFPPKALPGFTTSSGSAGNGWVSGEVQQENNRITWFLNGVIIAQFTNTSTFTNGDILIGYNDVVPSTGGAANFVIFDNLRVEAPGVPPTAIQLTGLAVSGGAFQFSFTNAPGAVFTVVATTNVTLPLSNWTTLGGVTEISPGQFQFTDTQATNNVKRFYRVRSP